MGACWSNRLKVVNPSYPGGANSRNPRGNGNNPSGNGSKPSSSSASRTLMSEGEILECTDLKTFSFSELKSATRKFRADYVLGEDGFSIVYKGWLDEHTLAPSRPGNGIAIAVKRLNQSGFLDDKEWLAKIIYLGQLHHPNLVKLIGYCLEDNQRFVVYEFMPGGSLENHLFRTGSHVTPLPWSIRMKFALDAAKGLAFLHTAEQLITYPFFQISNILLDSNYNAKLSGFELVRDDEARVVREINGHEDPEFAFTGRFSTKSDVYGFGVVLLEMLTGRRAMDENRLDLERRLVDWAQPYLENKHRVLLIMDARIQGHYSVKQAMKAANLAIQCLAGNPRSRPKMDEVIKVLQQLQEPGDTGISMQ